MAAVPPRPGHAINTGELIRTERDRLYAPHLVDAEVGQALRRLVAAGELGAGEAEDSLVDLADLPLERSPHSFLLEAAWRLRTSVTFYDSLYLALAAELDEVLITLDGSLVRAAAKLPARVERLG